MKNKIMNKINKTMKNEYKPKPIDTKDVELGKELEELIEKMAKNVHEVWAQTRMNQGWVYGKERNDALKQHPCLVAYEELPESESEYDRNTALETLKLICKLGFKISRE
jgi:ryanodine receptor 2